MPEQTYTKTVSAMQYQGNNDEIHAWTGGAVQSAKPWKENYPLMKVAENHVRPDEFGSIGDELLVSFGDWVAIEADGCISVIDNAEFEATYLPGSGWARQC